MQYPNLTDVILHHPYSMCTFAGFANVTEELLEAVVYGDERLTDGEIWKLCYYAGFNNQFIKSPRLSMLDNTRRRHRKWVEELEGQLETVKVAYEKGSEGAARFLRYYRDDFFHRFSINAATYGHYLGAREDLRRALLSIKVEQKATKKRGLPKKEEKIYADYSNI